MALVGTLDHVNSVVNDTTDHSDDIVVTNSDLNAGLLFSVINGTTGIITLENNNSTVTGSTSEVTEVFSNVQQLVNYIALNVNLNDTPTESQLDNIDAFTTGTITVL
jgi:hypothetical protein